jgi:hypothetical protein
MIGCSQRALHHTVGRFNLHNTTSRASSMSLSNMIRAVPRSHGREFESTVYGLELVSLLVARYAAFEDLYLRKRSTIQADLQRELTNLYAGILTFLARGIQYFSQSTARRMASGDQLICLARKAGECRALCPYTCYTAVSWRGRSSEDDRYRNQLR